MDRRQRLANTGKVGLAALLALVTLPLVMLVPSGTAQALPQPVFTMYVPFTEQQISDSLFSIANNGALVPDDMVATMAITAAADDTYIYWDHWEDGYEADIANPTQPTTQVWGDSNAANGSTPDAATDDVDAGTVIFLQNDVPLPRVTTDVLFDGRDKVAGTRGFVLTRAGWDAGLGTLHAGSVAASDLSKYGTQFDVPVGENIGNVAFGYTGLAVMASDVDTRVEIDTDGDGDVDIDVVLQQGESHFVDGGVNAGATVQTSKPTQAHLITGEVGSNYEGRWYELFPEEIRGDEYVAAASSTSTAANVDIYLQNPNDTAITVAVDVNGVANDVDLTIGPGAFTSYTLPLGSGGRFSSPGNPFVAVSATGATGSGTNRSHWYDWGYSLVPVASLTPGVVVGWGDGAPVRIDPATGVEEVDPATGEPVLEPTHSPIWVVPLADTDVYVDFDGDGTADGFDHDRDALTPDLNPIPATAYQSLQIFDPADEDMTGARIYTLDGTLISVAWGQDPSHGECCIAFDLGTAVLPSTSLVVTKVAELVGDVNGDGNVNPGDTMEYTIRAVDAGALILVDVVIVDNLPPELTYVPGTTTVNGVSAPDDLTGSTLFPVDETGLGVDDLAPGEAAEVAFRTQIVDPFPPFLQNVRNSVTVSATDQPDATAVAIVPVRIPELYIGKTSNAAGPLEPGQTFSYDITVSNVAFAAQTGIVVGDQLPPELTWVSTSVERPVDGTVEQATETWTPAAYTNDAAFWTGPWIETDANGGGAASGAVRWQNELSSDRLRMAGPNSRIARFYDATDSGSLVLDLDWRRQSLDDTDETVSLQVSTTGGSSWIEIDRWQGPGSDATYQNTSYDLTRYTGQAVGIRLVTSAGFEADGSADVDAFWIDDVRLVSTERVMATVAGTAPGASSPYAVFTGADLLTNESLTATVTVTVDPGLDPTIDSITNTSFTQSVQNPALLPASAADPIARAQVGDTVWHDQNGDGVVDAGEPRLSGVTVTLYDAGSTVVDTAVTDVNGQYQFGGTLTDLDPGDYTVTVTAGVPAGMVPTFDADATTPLDADGTTDVTLGFGEVNTTTDFGFATPVTLGDTVFADLDGDGTQNGTDFGIGGLPVTITGPSHPTGTTINTAGGTGFYEFTGLLPGDYTVSVDISSLSTATYSTTGGNTQTPALVSGTDDDTVDFGYVIPAAIGDSVWHDLDADGVQDAGEPPFAGVIVEITGPGITGTETRVTDLNGFYIFTDLDAGTFDVTVVPGTGNLPADFDSSTGGASVSVTVGADDVVDTVDFGFYTQATIGDEVFEDVNGDGDRDPGEPGIDSVDVTITGTSVGASHPTGFTTQTVNGAYDFTDLEPGTYTVSVDDSGFAAGTVNTLDGASPSITVASGDDENDADFGYTFPATFGDKVFHDLNANNVQNSGEPGVNGVTMTLVDDNSGLTVGTATTSGDGDYLFSGLPIGDYTVTLDIGTLPIGYVITDGDEDDAAALPTSASSHLTADFGVHTTSDIGDTIFHDLNNDGDQDPGEPGLVGVEVTITGTDSGGLPIVVATPTQLTGAGGSYLFEDLQPGTYVVTVNETTTPADYAVTAGDNTRTTVLNSGTDDLDLDLGYATTGSIGDFIWDDIDGDGISNDGAAATVGFGAVDVNLTGVRSNGTVIPAQATTTDANGAYLFDNLEPGTYTVTVDTNDLPAGVVSSTGGSNSIQTIDSDEDDLTVDFGYTVGASIGDFVYIDSDADGSPTGETGLDAVTVTLSQGGTDIDTTTTSGGTYSFDDLLPGTYTVTITSTDLPNSGVGQIGATSQTVTITSGNASDTFDVDTDFGFYSLVDLGDFVFDDLNGNGTQDAGEPGINGVTIDLLQGGLVIDTTDTVNGTYLFADLLPGDYTVRIDTGDLDPNATISLPAAGDELSTTLTSGNDDLTLDFGVVNPITIGDFVYEDLNGNGTQDPLEPGIDGVTVTVIGTTAGASHSAGTTQDTVGGAYEFTNLLPGTYDVTVAATQTGGYTASTAVLASGSFVSGGSTNAFDFGFVRPAALGDKVFIDSNGNGVDDGEPGLAGVTLTLSGPGVPTGAGAPTVTTDGTGVYAFTGLTADVTAYTVTATTVPAGYTNTLGGASQSTVLESDETDNSLDFGYYFGASIGDTIYDDLNGNGTQDIGEPGFDTVVVQLDDGNPVTPVLTRTTDSSGNYDFVGLEPGTYTVSVQSGLPGGVVNTEGGASQTFTVVSGDTEVDGDFGYYRPGSIGDYLWEDSNGNGAQNEPVTNGIADVTVRLTGLGADGNTIPSVSTTTGINGAYTFTGLQPGDYTVTVDAADTDLAGRTLSTTGGFAQTSTIASGDDIDTIDFGVAAPGTIGDLVYADNDGTGTFTAGDVALDGVTLTLTGTDGNGATITPVATTTDASGAYEFSGLAPGNYTVTVTAAGGDLDGDEISTTGGLSQTTTMSSGDDIDTFDFGFAKPASIGDTLFEDLDGTGTQDPGEPGIADVTVVLTGPSFPTGSGTTYETGPTGTYTASNLLPGTYTVAVLTTDPDLDTDFVSSTGGNTQSHTLVAGQSIVIADFGYFAPVAIGDVVFLDDNADGDQTGDAGLGGVQIELTGGDLLVPLTTTTAAVASPGSPIGSYSFDGLTPGAYTVTITGGLPGNSVITTAGGSAQSSTTTSGNDDLDRDFGVAVVGSIGDFVYDDSDADGTQLDAAAGTESGYAGATVTITGPSHPGGFDVLTGATGAYLAPNLIPGQYTVSIVVPAGDTVIEGLTGYTIDLTSGETSGVADFGVVRPASIGDVVYDDLNGNGTQDAGEPGLDGVEVTLSGAAAGTATTSTVGGIAGTYVFSNLAPGDYTVTVTTLPAGGLPVGAVLVEGATAHDRTLESGDDVVDADFGFYVPVTIGDDVWDDLNGNGLQDDGIAADRGIAGIELTLDDGNALTVDPTTTTDANGFYEFTGVAPGAYTVTITDGLGADDTVTSSAGTIPGSTSANVLVVSGIDVDTLDFGIALPADLGDLVFIDANGNGTFDGADSGIASLPMVVTGTSAGASFPAGTTISTGPTGPTAGEYGQGNLLPGTYTVVIDVADLPAGAAPSTAGVVRDLLAGTDTLTTILESGESDLAVDFGYVLPASIGDQVFVDNNANGVFDAGDDPIATVDVTLVGPGFPTGTTVATDANGLYNFTDLAPGSYTVTLDVDDAQFDAEFPAGSEIATAGPAVRSVVLASNEVRTDVDFGFYALGSIGDLVFEDADASGSFGTGDGGIDAITVTLDDGNPLTPVVTVDTDANGAYVFTGLVPGTYTVTATVPGMVATTPGAANGTIQTVTIGSGDDHIDADFGFTAPVAIGDTIFHDLNGNGTQDAGEPGLVAITVTLSGGDLVTDLSVDTDANGVYGFTGLTPGDYVVTIDVSDLPSTAFAVTNAITADVAGDDTIDVTLTSGNDDLTIDAGYAAPVTLGDLVFEDTNGNGTFDAGEPGINGVTLELSGGDLAAPIQVTTATVGGVDGIYTFTGVDPSSTDYTITVVDPSGGVLTDSTNTLGGTTQTFLVVSDTDDLTHDFGYTFPAALGDTVFTDVDGNGNFNPAIDLLIDGATVTLDDGNPLTPTISVVTGSGAFGPGRYGFDDLAPGTYTATVTAGIPIDANVAPITVTLTSGQTDLDVDFPVVENVTIGDFVWHDLDDDGFQDIGEPGIDGVTVQLRNTATGAIVTDDTDINGQYLFTDVTPGDYVVEILAADRPVDYSVASGNTESIASTVTSGNDISDADFNYKKTATIGDFVWNDLDGDGIQDAGEPGIGSVLVQLVGEGVTLTASTDGSGGYSFSGLEPGDYVVTFGVPTGASVTTPAGNVIAVTVVSDQTDNSIDVGLADGASIGDRVFHDFDLSGAQNGTEPGLGGIEVLLDGPGGQRSDTTDGNGDYLFTGLAPGTYTVTINNLTVPVGAISGTQLTTTTHLGGPVQFSRTVASGGAVTDADFGYATTAIIGDTVFEDADGNGVQDGAEQGISGVTVELLTGTPGNYTVIDSVVTQAGGTYSFTGVAPGDYTVRIDPSTLPSGLDATSATTPDLVTINVQSDDSDLSADFGFAEPSTVGDRVWHDVNNNGVQNVGEPGLGSVQIQLVDATNLDPLTNVIATQTTDANGAYSFTGVDPGVYIVRVVPASVPSGLNSGLQMVASAGVPTSNTITVRSGDTIVDQDFGFHTVATIGDMVWFDLDADGVENDGAPTEPWLDAVIVELVDAATGIVVQTQTTTDGAYGFDNVAPGTYEVRVSNLPAGFSSTTGNNPLTVSVISDQVVDTADFGFASLTGGSLGNESYEDLNGDGDRDPGESGFVVGVELFLDTGAPGAPIWTSQRTRTTTGGGYLFANLAPGSYEVRVDPATVPAGYTPTTPGGLVRASTITSGQADLDLDFGFVAAATIGDFVWHDLDLDGTQNDGLVSVVSLENVTIEVRTLAGALVASAVTDANGAYSIDVAPGTYDVVLLPASIPSGVNSGNPMTSTTPATVRVTVASNENRTELDFGLATTASIGDTIFDDLDGDGTEDLGEPGLANVTVILDDGNPLTVPVTAVTDSNGVYSFPGLAPGDYTVTIDPTTLPSGYQPTTSSTPVDVSLRSDEERDDVDLGYVRPGTISGMFFTDGNADGDQTGDAGVGGVTIELLDDGGLVIDTATTAGDGSYTFTNVLPGDYTVRPTLPTGTVLTVPNNTGDDTTDSDVLPATGVSQVITMTSGSDVTDIDVGVFEPATIGDTVFIDLDGNGTQSADEPGLPGVVVTVRDSGGQVIGAATTTDADGNYAVDVVPGTHTVSVAAPNGYATPAGGDVQPVTIASGETDLDVDFAVVGTGSLAGQLVYDVSNDGVINPTDPGLGGVPVTATWNGPNGPVVRTTTTNPDGSYRFSDLPPGDWTVAIDPAELPNGIVDPTIDPDGTNDLTNVVSVSGAVTGIDFGVSGTASIGDNVFVDLNENGVLDPGEPGVPGVRVTTVVNTVAGPMTFVTFTDANGNYEFVDLPAGDYTVTLDLTSLPEGMASNDPSKTTTLVINGIDLSLDLPVVLRVGPTANPDVRGTPIDTPVTIPVLDNDTTVIGTTVTVVSTTNPGNGTVVINPNGTITYTPNTGYTGTDVFEYTICDLDGIARAGDTPAMRDVFCSTTTVTIQTPPPETVTVGQTDSGTPAATPNPTAIDTPTATSSSQPMPRTGSDTGPIQTIALMLLIAGLFLFTASRRRRDDLV